MASRQPTGYLHDTIYPIRRVAGGYLVLGASRAGGVI
jgi:hypothetical protein